ncbi:protoglobin domain-containing protein [Tunturiibacter psychrotolerans]|uniref:protoglobin domain-containing protein n=1 Tax=Tunturiibacter psychrotolerans TaxID=3069686 RepID=UPI003D1C2692
MKKVADEIPAYSYGTPAVGTSPVSLDELNALKVSVGFTVEDECYLRMAGEVLDGQTKQIVAHWRSGIIASIPNLARHSRTPEGAPNPEYLAKSNLRFEQWILDTCLRPYDQDWLNYQHEIALRHTSIKKNQADGVQSTAYIPFRDVVAFAAVLNDTIRTYLTAKGHSDRDIAGMHLAWTRSLQMQIVLWTKTYMDLAKTSNEW